MYNSMCVFHWPIHMICILYVCFRAGDWRHIGSQHAEKTIQKIFAKIDFWWKCDFKHFQRFPQKTCQRFQTFQTFRQKHFPKNKVFKHFKFQEIWCHFTFSLTAGCKPLNYNWCSGASQMNNSWKYMILQTFLTIVKCYLVSTRAPLTKMDIKQRP